MYLFTNILGAFVFDDSINLVEKIDFKDINEFLGKDAALSKLRQKYKKLEEPYEETLQKILLHFKDNNYRVKLRDLNLAYTKMQIRNSVNEDLFIIQSINTHDELEKTINQVVKRLREWYSLHNPEFSEAVSDHEEFVRNIVEFEKNELLEKIKQNPEDSMGADFTAENLLPLKSLAQQAYDLYSLKNSLIDYISKIMDGFCPNIKAVCGPNIAAKLIGHTGSLKRLSELPSSTIQVLGAEVALFRHMKTGAKPPRHGVIAAHSLMGKFPNKLHGKVARALADKISIAAKIDYFRGQFIGDKLVKEIEEKLSKIK